MSTMMTITQRECATVLSMRYS